MQIEVKDTDKEDWDYLSNNLNVFTLSKGGLNYVSFSKTFNAVSKNRKIGSIIASNTLGDGEIEMFFVEKKYRGKGVGKTLLSIAEEFLKAVGATGVKIWTPTWEGKGFYEKCGYSEVFRLPYNLKGSKLEQDRATQNIFLYYNTL